MVSGEISGPCFRQQDHCLRDIARLLSSLRDAEVRLQTVRQIQHITRRKSAEEFKQTEQLLLMELEHFLAAFAGWQKEAEEKLTDVCEEMEKWSVEGLDCKQLRSTAQSSYKAARDSFIRAEAKPSAAKFHQFRSRTKRLYYQLRILRPVNSVVIGVLLEELHSLTTVLGRSHDLHFLRERLGRDSAYSSAMEVFKLMAVIQKTEAELQDRAVDLASRFFEERPRDFGRCLGVWLEDWMAGKAPNVADALICEGDVPRFSELSPMQ